MPSRVVTAEMPSDAPRLRSRFNMLDPSVRYCGGMVAKAMVLSGMNTNPMPSPCTTPLMTTGRIPISSDQWLICHSE